MMRVILTLLMVVVWSFTAMAATSFVGESRGPSDLALRMIEEADPDARFVMLDDMAFRIETLRRSGFHGDPWTDGYVYYAFHVTVPLIWRQIWVDAAEEWEQVADLHFVERTNEDNYILVFIGDGNWSEVGMAGGQQDMSIVNWDKWIIAHEIGHALGFGHEHQREDRVLYMNVQYGCIQDDYHDQYEINQDMNLIGEYDFDSVMHYDQCAFSVDCPPGFSCPCTCLCMLLFPPYQDWQDLIGQRDHLSELDGFGAAAIYGAPRHGPIFVDSSWWGLQNGSLYFPFRFLESALDYAYSDASIVVKAGSHEYAPILINQFVQLQSWGGTAVIE